jgi:superfamily II DNA or RNA helicase
MVKKAQLRGYQQEAINAIFNEPYGSRLIIALAVGLP